MGKTRRKSFAKSYAAQYLNHTGELKKLGKGSYAKVWEANGLAIKVTRDAHDAIMSQSTITKNLIHMVKTNRVVKFYTPESKYLYIIENEVLLPIGDLEEYGALCYLINNLNFGRVLGRDEEIVKLELKNAVDYVLQLGRFKIEQLLIMEKYISQLFEMFKEVEHLKMQFFDLHKGNVGVDAEGTLKYLDLGHHSSSGYEGMIEEIDLNPYK